MKRVLVIIPAYNEAQALPGVLTSLSQAVASARQRYGVEVDVVVINDGSTDETSATARRHGVRVIDLTVNLGIGGAVQTGYQYAQRFGYDYAVQLDADGQHDTQNLPVLIEAIATRDCDMIVGSRFLRREGFQSSPLRRLGKNVISWVIYWCFGRRITDPTSGYRIVGKRLIAFFAADYPHDYPEPESIAAALHIGCKIDEIPVAMHARTHGASSINTFKSAHYMVKLILAIGIEWLRTRRASTAA